METNILIASSQIVTRNVMQNLEMKERPEKKSASTGQALCPSDAMPRGVNRIMHA